MATRVLTRSIFTIHRSIFSRSYTSLSPSSTPQSSSFFRQRRLIPFAVGLGRTLPTATTSRGFATGRMTSSLKDSSPNWSNRPPKETILLDGCDFEHWLVVMEKPEDDTPRDVIIDSYIKTLAQVVGSEDEARMKIYSLSTRHYFAFGALVSEELSYKIKELPKVRWVLPDSYLDVRNKDYGGEPFINGQAVPYEPKYHEEWVRNYTRATNPPRRRNSDQRNFQRRENLQQNRGPNRGGAPPNMGGGPPPHQGNMGGGMLPQGNMSGGMPPQGNMGGGLPPHQGNMGGGMPPHQGNMGGGMPPHQGNMGGGMLPQGNMSGGMPPQGNMGEGLPPHQGNMGGGMPPHQGNMGGGAPPQNNGSSPPPNYNGPNFQQRGGPNSGGVTPYQQGPPVYQDAPRPPNIGGGNSYSQGQDIPGRGNY